MLLSLAVDTFRENKKNLLLWGAGLMLTVIFAAIFWPEDLVISSVMDADSSFGLGWQWHSFWKYLQIFLLPGYVSIFSIVEGSRLLAGRTAIGLASRRYISGLSLADCVFSGRRAGRAAAQAPASE